ncbi:MAG TPA: hypothetical protein VL096_06875, partial [Pirellulaceae bacterium]|nr:hypothetical protein [Pirellulaceae bacterium]
MNRTFLSLAITLLSLASPALASAQDVDIAAWSSVPVFEAKGNSGRVEPLESFAKQAMDDITTQIKGNLKLNLVDYVPTDTKLEDSEYAPALAMFPEGKVRAIPPSELVLSWLCDTKEWEVVPFIFAAHKSVRELVGVPDKND